MCRAAAGRARPVAVPRNARSTGDISWAVLECPSDGHPRVPDHRLLRVRHPSRAPFVDNARSTSNPERPAVGPPCTARRETGRTRRRVGTRRACCALPSVINLWTDCARGAALARESTERRYGSVAERLSRPVQCLCSGLGSQGTDVPRAGSFVTPRNRTAAVCRGSRRNGAVARATMRVGDVGRRTIRPERGEGAAAAPGRGHMGTRGPKRSPAPTSRWARAASALVGRGATRSPDDLDLEENWTGGFHAFAPQFGARDDARLDAALASV